jgi:hypothetical protein
MCLIGELMKKLISVICLAIFVSGCVTTALYGAKFENTVGDEYTLEIAYGGLPVTTTNDNIIESTTPIVTEEAEKFLKENSKYSSYEIKGHEVHRFNRYIVYTVMFK